MLKLGLRDRLERRGRETLKGAVREAPLAETLDLSQTELLTSARRQPIPVSSPMGVRHELEPGRQQERLSTRASGQVAPAAQ